jgi:hypothetical protein
MNNDWEKQFDQIRLTMCDSQEYLVGHNRALDKCKTITKYALDEQREELREWAEGEINKNVFITTSDIGYNQAMNDLLTKLEKK